MWTWFWTGPSVKNCSKDFEKADIKALAFWENGFRHLTNSKGPVKKVEDGKGLKIRTMENKVHLAAWKAAGLNPTPMAWGEVFTALQQKVIDGQENPIAVFYSSKLWDAGQKHFSLTEHVYSPSPFLMSKKTFDAMPKEDQQLFVKTGMEVAKFQRKINRDAEEAKLQGYGQERGYRDARRGQSQLQEGHGADLQRIQRTVQQGRYRCHHECKVIHTTPRVSTRSLRYKPQRSGSPAEGVRSGKGAF